MRSCVAALAVLLVTRAMPASAQARPEEPPPAAEPALVGVNAVLSSSMVMRSAPAQSTLLMVLSGSYDFTAWLSSFVRLGWVRNAPSNAEAASGIANPALGFTGQVPFGKHVKVGGVAGATLPLGSGGGNTPHPAALKAWVSSVDWGGAMFAVDHVDVFGGLKASYSLDRFTLQVESTLHQLGRVRGEAVDPIGAAATVTGSQATASCAILPALSLSSGLAETRFWNTPKAIRDSPDSRVDYFFIVGASLDLRLARGIGFTPGLLYARALDLPLRAEKFQVVELDLGLSL